MIEIDVQKSVGGFKLDVALSLKRGEFVGIMGASGSGKTTLLRIVAGLEKATGRIAVGDEVWLDGKKSLPPQKRFIGFIFQEYALFENMSVLGNLLYVSKDRALASKLLQIVELEELQDRYPAQLSGGQKQRVALARAMMRRPKLLLLDEPLSALDSTMRLKLQNEIVRLHEEFGTTTLMVSHDRGELLRLSDRIFQMQNGRLIEEKRNPIIDAVRV